MNAESKIVVGSDKRRCWGGLLLLVISFGGLGVLIWFRRLRVTVATTRTRPATWHTGRGTNG